MISLNCQNPYPKNKINFSANIKFEELKTFNKKIIQETVVEVGHCICSVEQTQSGKNIGTSGILMCNAGGITGGNTDNNLMFHLYPDRFFGNLPQNLIKLKQKFQKTLSSLKQEQKEPQALIFGGDIKSEDSKDLMVVLKHFFEKYKIDHTVFWGTGNKNKPLSYSEKNIFYDGNKDTWYVNLMKSGESVLDKEKALDSFNFIEVSSKDKVKFSDTGWLSGKEKGLCKGNLDLTVEDVFRKHGTDPKILEALSK